ncbi:hypothetical protein AMJ96_CH02682 [Rhizobium sp. N113]|nr:hypothetical protein AMJ98_CH02678 [Rhizobium sp. N1341]ANL22379.1 hypothetical protein AMJ96_CH02682 [Rhizobium sp. N113]ANM41080.1 hypothetical protein AMK03_CH02585 [Rhizobium sp. N741]
MTRHVISRLTCAGGLVRFWQWRYLIGRLPRGAAEDRWPDRHGRDDRPGRTRPFDTSPSCCACPRIGDNLRCRRIPDAEDAEPASRPFAYATCICRNPLRQRHPALLTTEVALPRYERCCLSSGRGRLAVGDDGMRATRSRSSQGRVNGACNDVLYPTLRAPNSNDGSFGLHDSAIAIRAANDRFARSGRSGRALPFWKASFHYLRRRQGAGVEALVDRPQKGNGPWWNTVRIVGLRSVKPPAEASSH